MILFGSHLPYAERKLFALFKIASIGQLSNLSDFTWDSGTSIIGKCFDEIFHQKIFYQLY